MGIGLSLKVDGLCWRIKKYQPARFGINGCTIRKKPSVSTETAVRGVFVYIPSVPVAPSVPRPICA